MILSHSDFTWNQWFWLLKKLLIDLTKKNFSEREFPVFPQHCAFVVVEYFSWNWLKLEVNWIFVVRFHEFFLFSWKPRYRKVYQTSRMRRQVIVESTVSSRPQFNRNHKSIEKSRAITCTYHKRLNELHIDGQFCKSITDWLVFDFHAEMEY